MLVAADDLGSGDSSDMYRPRNALRKVSSFSVGDRLRNMMRQKQVMCNSDVAPNLGIVTTCQRCAHVC